MNRNTLRRTHTRTLALSLYISRAHTTPLARSLAHKQILPFSFTRHALSQTHTLFLFLLFKHRLTLSLFLSHKRILFPQTHTLFLFLSLNHTQTLSHTHKHQCFHDYLLFANIFDYSNRLIEFKFEKNLLEIILIYRISILFLLITSNRWF